MKTFIAGLCHETSAFSPIPTSRQSFEDFIAYRPAGPVIDAEGLELNGYGDFAREAARRGDTLCPSAYFWAQPSGPCVREDYEALRDEILRDLAAADDVDCVLLFLHGAQMAEGYDDCEGDFLQHVRAIVGPNVFVGGLLDLHANISPAMLEAADALVACRNYPHSDFGERAVDLYHLAARAVRGEVKPDMIFERLPMVGMFYTTAPLMAAANAAARKLETSGAALSTSLIHGFLWADTPGMGAGVLVVSDGPGTALASAARRVGEAFFDAREETRALRLPASAILERIESAEVGAAPFVVADACDNPGGGAGSDSTFILEKVLDRGLSGYAFAYIWDPVAVQFALAAGEGAMLRLRLGGKTGPEAGQPLDVTARVGAIGRNLVQRGLGFTAPAGTAIALEIAGNLVVINDVRGQVFSPTCFTDLGISPGTQRALVVKSTQHFREQFEPIAREILYCETPGALSLDIDPGRYRNLQRPIWPVDEVGYAA